MGKIVLLTSLGWSSKAIAKKLEVGERTVTRDRKRAGEETPTHKTRTQTVVTPANVAMAKPLFTSKNDMSKRKVPMKLTSCCPHFQTNKSPADGLGLAK